MADLTRSDIVQAAKDAVDILGDAKKYDDRLQHIGKGDGTPSDAGAYFGGMFAREVFLQLLELKKKV